MARMSKEEQARREGMAYALRFAREKGLDALEADLKMRNAIDLPLRVSKADLDKFSDNVKYNTVLYVKILMAVTMHDEFGFGNKRIKQMFERFDNKAECIAEDYSTWEEQISIIAEEFAAALPPCAAARKTAACGAQTPAHPIWLRQIRW